MHKSGFVNIIGEPNVGKSTLMNALVGDKMSVINSKPQTTRHRIMGIYNDDEHQIVFSDTPGWIDAPNYKMQEVMNKFSASTFEDADLSLLIIDVLREPDLESNLIRKLSNTGSTKILVINKIDAAEEEQISKVTEAWQSAIEFDYTFKISAKDKIGLEDLFDKIKELLPEGPEYYPKDQLTDKPERFFVSEIIRGKILELYHQEIPYSAEVAIEEFKESELRGEDFVRIRANIFVSRKTQKAIIIGKGGQAIKQLGIHSRKDIEEWLGKRIHLELYVRVADDWRNNNQKLKQFGYQ
jgi:GTP-binding protein Era